MPPQPPFAGLASAAPGPRRVVVCVWSTRYFYGAMPRLKLLAAPASWPVHVGKERWFARPLASEYTHLAAACLQHHRASKDGGLSLLHNTRPQRPGPGRPARHNSATLGFLPLSSRCGTDTSPPKLFAPRGPANTYTAAAAPLCPAATCGQPGQKQWPSLLCNSDLSLSFVARRRCGAVYRLVVWGALREPVLRC
jgi:hypothetical protein